MGGLPSKLQVLAANGKNGLIASQNKILFLFTRVVNQIPRDKLLKLANGFQN